MATVMAKCSKCKQFFEMDEELYNHRRAHRSKINCPECLKQSHINRYKKIGAATKRAWESYTPEEREKRAKSVQDGIHNMSDEKKALRSLHSSIATKKYMASLPEEVKQRRSEMTTKQMIERNAKMTHEEYVDYATKVRNTMMANRDYSIKMSKPEMAFRDALTDNFIRYEYHSANAEIHPEFFKLFPDNPITGSRFVNPYHFWDFKLFTDAGEVFVDVDGSIHWYTKETIVHPQSGKEYNLVDNIQFKESQRKYQCDDLQAFAIKMPNDKLTDDTEVINIRTEETIKFSEFINKLKLMDNPSKKVRKMGFSLYN